MRKRLAEQAVVPVNATPADTAKFLQHEIDKWGKLKISLPDPASHASADGVFGRDWRRRYLYRFRVTRQFSPARPLPNKGERTAPARSQPGTLFSNPDHD